METDPIEAFRVKTERVAQCLPPWQVKPDTSRYREQALVTLTTACVAGAEVYLRLAERGRIAIWGGYPEGFRPLPEQCPRITVAATRTARSIADDITRRFLPEYLPLYEKAAEQARAFAESQARSNRALDALAEALGATVRRYSDMHGDGEIRHYGRRLGLALAQPYDRDGEVTVKLELSRVPLETALAICRLVGPLMA